MRGNNKNMPGIKEYIIKSIGSTPELQGLWDGPVWGQVPALEIAEVRPDGSDHKPVTKCKLGHNAEGLFGIYQVQDKFVRCVHTDFQSQVFKDSCVEIFLEPKPGQGYFNFEFNCGGALLAFHINDCTRVGEGFKQYEILPDQSNQMIQRFHSLSGIIEPEISQELTWYLEFFIPFAVMESYVGPLSEQGVWRGNVYKCGDETSHPHWISWAPLERLDFHSPSDFGLLKLE